MAGGSPINGFLPFITMVIVQFGYAGMNIMSKVVMDSGMEPLVLVAYRQIFATIALLPFAYFMERKTRPKITKFILFQIFICSFFGATLNQVFYFLGLKNSTATISCALSNILPAVTFLLAVPFGLEVVGIKKLTGQAKVIGTLVCVSGAMLLSFYHGHVIGIGRSKIEWKYAREFQDGGAGGRHPHGGSPIASFFSGPFLLLASNVSWAIWFIVQAKMGESFQAPYTSSALMCLMSSIQCVLVALVPNHTLQAWSLKSRIRLFASMYAGFVGSALGFSLMSWTIQRRGPLYVSVFSPLLLVIVAILSWALLKEELFVGTAVGSFLIIFGLYAVLWGKSKETAEAERSKMDVIVPEPNGRLHPGQLIDLELQQPPASPQPKSHMYARVVSINCT